MTVDFHAHIIVPAMLRDAGPGDPWRPRVVRSSDGVVVEAGGREVRSVVHEFADIEAILAVQLARGVDRVVLSPWVPLLRYEAEPPDALRTGRVQNAALADLVRAYPRRVSALGTVPLQDPAMAAGELEGVLRDYGLSGVEIASSVRGAYLGDDRFRPFWEAAEGTGAVVFVHPTTRGFDLPALSDYYLWNAVGNPLETTISAAHMVMAGVLETYPKLKVVLAHGGGALASLRGRLRHAHAVQPPARSRVKESPDESIRRFYFDTVVHDTEVLRALVAFAGAEHVLLGSDYPFDMGDEHPVDMVRALALPPDAEARILGGNAAQLITSKG